MQKNTAHNQVTSFLGSTLELAWDFLRKYAKKCRRSYLTMLNL